jgi:phosphonoacetaldehyde hydrolase
MNETKSPSGVRAVIFDISGTVLDYGSRAPVAALVELFARHGVSITPEEARRPMGMHKHDHIRAMLSEPPIAKRWAEANGGMPSAAVFEALYTEFAPLQVEFIKRHCDVIPGAVEVVCELRSRGIKIANTTGYDSTMIGDLIKLAARAGYEPDLWVCPDHVGQGRPAPWMIHHAARHFGLFPLSTFVKVGDTPVDVAEARNAGAWAVSVVRSGNEVGLSPTELAQLPNKDRQAKLESARAKLQACGPHYMIETVADLMPVIDEISTRIARSEKP